MRADRHVMSAAEHADIYDKFRNTQGRFSSVNGGGSVLAGKQCYGTVPATYCVTLNKSGVPVCERTEQHQCCEQHSNYMTGIESL